MSQDDRYYRDQLFADGFAKMARGEYRAGLRSLQIASGAEHFEELAEYRIDTGIFALSEISKAARGVGGAVDPAALVFHGAEAEFKGFVERRTGESPDYRIAGYANHFGEAIRFYRRAASMGYPVGEERLEALRLRLGDADFRLAEAVDQDTQERAQAHLTRQASEIRQMYGIPERPSVPEGRPPKQSAGIKATEKAVTKRVWITYCTITLAWLLWFFLWPKDGAFDCGLSVDMVAYVESGDVSRVLMSGSEVAFNQGSHQGANTVLVQVPEFSDSYFLCSWASDVAVLGIILGGIFFWPMIGYALAAVVWRLHPDFAE